jgi:hypothetical protein
VSVGRHKNSDHKINCFNDLDGPDIGSGLNPPANFGLHAAIFDAAGEVLYSGAIFAFHPTVRSKACMEFEPHAIQVKAGQLPHCPPESGARLEPSGLQVGASREAYAPCAR